MEIVQDYGWRPLAGGKPHLRAVRWPILLSCLSGESGGQLVLAPGASSDQVMRSLLHAATARALPSTPPCYHGA